MRVIEELEGQIMLASGCPGLLVYGRRRMGKSTLLRNLAGFLPGSVLTAGFSMQNPSAFTSPTSLASLIARTAREAVGDSPSAAAPETLPALFDALADINRRLEESDRRLVLACDEFEAIDSKIGERVFTLDLLSTIRELVQTHRRITWIFAGSHDLGELERADWSSYFVSLRTVEVSAFSLEETRLLLTEPLKWSPLWQDRPAERPRFDPSFWGERGIERIQEETAGWPHLVQLAAETAVDIANDKGARKLDTDLLEAAFAKSVGRGDVVLRQLLEGENRYAHEWDYLLAFRDRESQPPPADPDIHRALRRRLLVTESDGQWRMRVPLMRRWLIDRC